MQRKRAVCMGAAPFVLAGFGLAHPAFAEAFIVKDGQPQAEIVISEQPARMVKLAAEELQTYIEKITGAKLPITTTLGKAVPVQIYVGKSAHTDRLKITDEGLKYGAFCMVSGKDYLALIGHDSDFKPREPYLRNNGDMARLMAEWDKVTGEKWGFPLGNLYKQYSGSMKIWEKDECGSLNAVYEFLRVQGVRWYLPDPLNGVAGRKPAAAYPWYFNICRQRVRDNGTKFSAFSPTGQTHFHDLAKFGKLYIR